MLASALAVLFALVVPLAGTAFAQPSEDESRLDLQPDADTAALGTCNEFVVVVHDAQGQRHVNQNVAITIFQSDPDLLQDLEIGYCDPETEPGTPEATGMADCDDNVGGSTAGGGANDGGCAAFAGSGTESPAVASLNCRTVADDESTPEENEAGTCTFGVYSTEPGQMRVGANHFTTDQSGNPQSFTDTSIKTWVAPATQVNAEPEDDTNPVGTQHIIGVFAGDVNNQPTTFTTIRADILPGSANQNNTPQAEITCAADPDPATDRGTYPAGESETHECSYTGNNSGTDMIRVFGDLNDNSIFDEGEPFDDVLKRWMAPPPPRIAPPPPRIIDCGPETAENPPGTQHTITCVVTDREDEPVFNATVTFAETGPGQLEGPMTRQTDTTGTVTITTSTSANEEGTQEITGTLNNQPECERAAGDPTGAPAGVCADTVVKNWVADQPPPPPPPPAECEDNLDNDADGLIDFPNDPGCVSPDDDSEAEAPEIQPRGACRGFPMGSRTAKADGSGFVIVGTQAGEIIVGTEEDDTICALGGNDQVDALGGADQVFAGGGDDEIDGGGGRDQLHGRAGNDTISGRAGHDTIFGGAGDDVLKGNRGIDSIRGGDGRDILQGGIGEDTLYGGDGDDTLRGWTGNDVLYGGPGNDSLNGHAGIDVCRGGPGPRDVVFNCERNSTSRQ